MNPLDTFAAGLVVGPVVLLLAWGAKIYIDDTVTRAKRQAIKESKEYTRKKRDTHEDTWHEESYGKY